jgi:hypothetical protein
MNTNSNTDLFSIQLLIKNKKQEIQEAIQADKTFKETKVLFLQLKELKLQLEKLNQSKMDLSDK